jgi:methylmalonyl-CoA mutase C-terminal domain/subunit
MKRPIRVVVAKAGLDGHDRGAKVVARALRDAGMEVIYTGVHQTPEQVVETALQEDADCIGVSLLSGAHMYVFPRIAELMKEKGMTDVLLFGGGIIPEDDAERLKEHGVERVFQPGASLEEIVTYLRDAVTRRRGISSGKDR